MLLLMLTRFHSISVFVIVITVVTRDLFSLHNVCVDVDDCSWQHAADSAEDNFRAGVLSSSRGVLRPLRSSPLPTLSRLVLIRQNCTEVTS